MTVTAEQALAALHDVLRVLDLNRTQVSLLVKDDSTRVFYQPIQQWGQRVQQRYSAATARPDLNSVKVRIVVYDDPGPSVSARPPTTTAPQSATAPQSTTGPHSTTAPQSSTAPRSSTSTATHNPLAGLSQDLHKHSAGTSSTRPAKGGPDLLEEVPMGASDRTAVLKSVSKEKVLAWATDRGELKDIRVLLSSLQEVSSLWSDRVDLGRLMTDADVKRNYRKAILIFHPDKAATHMPEHQEIFHFLHKAYEVYSRKN